MSSQVVTQMYGLVGTAGADIFSLDGLLSHNVDGGAGVDTVFYPNLSTVHTEFAANGSILVQSPGVPFFQADVLTNVERVKFIDKSIAFDLGVNQSAGETALFMNAVLGKDSLTANKPLAGILLGIFDQGVSQSAFSSYLFSSGVLANATGKANATSTDIATFVLTNATGTVPDAATLAAAVNQLDTGDKAAWLTSVVTSTAAQQHVDLVGLSHTGIAYV